MVQTITINPLTFDGLKFATRYSITRSQFRVVGETTLEYPDSLPAPGALVIETPDPIERIVTATKYIRTADATPTPVLTHAIPTNSAVEIQGIVSVFSGTNVGKFWGLSQMKRAGAGASVVASRNIIPPILDVGIATAAVGITAVGNDGVITVTGIAATTIDWFVELRARVFKP